MNIFDLTKHVEQQTPMNYLELPNFDSVEDATKYLSDVQDVCFKYKQYIMYLHKADSICSLSELGLAKRDLMIEYDNCPIYEDCTLNIIHSTLKHASHQLKKLNRLFDDVEAWISQNSIEYPCDCERFKV